MTQKIILEFDGAVGMIRLNNPAALNALSIAMIEDINAALDECEAKARAVIITAEGRAFSAGADLAAPMTGESTTEQDVGSSLETHVNPLMRRLRNLSIPWITAVRGAAAGFGCSLALAGDLVIASRSAYFLLSFAKIGLVPDGGASYLLARSIGRARTMELALLGERLGAEQALEWGLINRMVDDEQLEASAREIAGRLAAGPRSLGLIRRGAWAAVDTNLDDTLSLERSLQRQAGATQDFAEGVAAFMAKRSPVFTGR